MFARLIGFKIPHNTYIRLCYVVPDMVEAVPCKLCKYMMTVFICLFSLASYTSMSSFPSPSM